MTNRNEIEAYATATWSDVEAVTMVGTTPRVEIAGKAYGNGYDVYLAYANGKLVEENADGDCCKAIAEALMKKFKLKDLIVSGYYD
jgi:hypothetical protein